MGDTDKTETSDDTSKDERKHDKYNQIDLETKLKSATDDS